jgi:hypothetical protein
MAKKRGIEGRKEDDLDEEQAPKSGRNTKHVFSLRLDEAVVQRVDRVRREHAQMFENLDTLSVWQHRFSRSETLRVAINEGLRVIEEATKRKIAEIGEAKRGDR